MNNLHAERSVLGSLLTQPKAAYALDVLNVDDFEDPTCKTLFELISKTAASDTPPSIVAITPLLAQAGVGNAEMMQTLAFAGPVDQLRAELRSLKEYSARRRMVMLGGVMHTAGSTLVSVLDLAEDVAREVDDISASLRNTKPTSATIGELTQRVVDTLQSGDVTNLVDTGLSDLNKDIGGFSRGEMTILAGRPGMGKTTLALSMLRQAARKSVSSMLFSMEMPSTAVAARLISDALFSQQMPVPYKDIIRGDLPSWGLDRIQTAQDTLADLPMLVDDQAGLTVTEIGVRARRYQDQLETRGKTLDVICVDHIGFVKASGAYKGQRHLELGEITKGLKALAKSLDVAVLGLCQLNRENEKRENRRPELSDLRNSGEIEEDADTVLAAYRKAYYLEKTEYEDEEKERNRLADLEKLRKIVEVIGLKTRNGPTFSRKFFADMGSNYIRDMAA
jgi:replicative DNA helicase